MPGLLPGDALDGGGLAEEDEILLDDPEMFTPRPLTSTRRSVGVPSALIRASGCTLNLSVTSSVLGATTVTILPLFTSTLQKTYSPLPPSISVPPLTVRLP